MEKLFFRVKKNNEGVSLVEVLVTIAMIIIMAGPLINGFLNAMGVNGNAREIQNGTTVAQDILESFEALSVEELCDKYKDNMALDAHTGVYTFSSIPVDGPNGEDFLVDITLDPTPYNEGNGDRLELNNVNLPGMSSLHGSNSIMLYKQYAAADEELKELFGTSLGSSITDSIYAASNKRRISKDTNIEITCTYNSSTKKYDYDIRMTMKYSYKKSDASVVTAQDVRVIEDMLFEEGSTHNIYLICPIFDLYTYDNGGDKSYATDKINIDYHFIGPDNKKEDVYFYLAEQEAKNLDYTSRKQRLKPQNIKVENNDLTIYNANSTNVKLLTNVGKNMSDLTDLTYINQNTGIALYEMNVKVRLSGETKVIAEFTSAK